MTRKTVHLTLPADLVKLIDQAAIENYSPRSDYIKNAAVQRLQSQGFLVMPLRKEEVIEEAITDPDIQYYLEQERKWQE